MPRGPYTFNPRTLRYHDRRGRFVPRRQIRAALDDALDNAGRRIRALAEDLRERRISIREWQLAMAQEVKSVHLYSGAIAKGGWDQLSQADFGRIGRILRDEYSFLGSFAQEIENGLPLDGRYTQRVGLYVQSGRRTMHLVERAEMAVRGFDLEASHLNPADHCGECVAEDRKGYQPIGQMIPIGSRTCTRRCKCSVSYKNSATGELMAA